MPKFDVWFEMREEYCVTLEADSYEQALDMVYENPESVWEDRTWCNSEIYINHWQEVANV